MYLKYMHIFHTQYYSHKETTIRKQLQYEFTFL